MANVQYSESKFAELILYVSAKCARDGHFGATKLNKILYFSDFLAYGRYGEAITGAEYQHLLQGPAPRRLVPVRNRLIDEGALKITSVDAGFGFTQKRSIALRSAILEEFSASQIALVDSVIAALTGKSATDASNLSHLDFGWQSTKDGETIDYGTVFISSAPANEVDEQRAAELAEELVMVA